MKETGIVRIHGKDYQTVALRVTKLRTEHPDWTIDTDVLMNAELILIKATIHNEEGRLIGTGHAEEKRGSSNINKDSALENCETSAIGRALAACGYGGTEYASANEMEKSVETINEKQVKIIMDLVADASADVDKFLEYCGVKTFEDIPASFYSEAETALKAKIDTNEQSAKN